MRSRFALLVAVAAIVAGVAAPAGESSRRLLVGVYDEPEVLGNPAKAFPVLRTLRSQVVRVNLYWARGFGRAAATSIGVARRRPAQPADPDDPAYDWEVYDRMVTLAAKYRIRVMFSIVGTPGWANGGQGPSRAPRRPSDLQNFAYAAATRYSGQFYTDPDDPDAEPLPPVRLWLAWNEPNNPIFLGPQYRRVRGRWIAQSPIDYARICRAVWLGVHMTGLANQKVACGSTSPRGNNQPRSRRPSISPLAFVRGFAKARPGKFDAYAHHPYYGLRSETPTAKPRAKTAVILGNINDLVREVTRLFGRKRIWITEYGYQTRPPDRLFGVTWSKQAAYLRQAFAIARRHPRIDMMLWFLIRDQPSLGDWQSGFLTASGRRKPSFTAFQRLPR